MQLIQQAVGLGGNNNPIDTAVIQFLLKKYYSKVPPLRIKGRSCTSRAPSIQIDGQCTPPFLEALKAFQTAEAGMDRPDACAHPNGRTVQRLACLVPAGVATVKDLLFGASPAHTGLLRKVKPRLFRDCYARQQGLGLAITRGEDLLGFFNYLQNDPEIRDIRWAAYILATVDIETALTFKPVGEDGKGGIKTYGTKKLEVVDVNGHRGPKNARYLNTYYGRGYCQLTHDENYMKIGNALGLNDELYINPEKVCESKLAYKIISFGMRNGVFTGYALKDYIDGSKCDYKNARRIINGNDRDTDFAVKANLIEVILRVSAGETLSILPSWS